MWTRFESAIFASRFSKLKQCQTLWRPTARHRKILHLGDPRTRDDYWPRPPHHSPPDFSDFRTLESLQERIAAVVGTLLTRILIPEDQ
jgi:hypothetical protein